MKALFSLTSSEGKRLIAKAVVKMPEVEKALKNHKIIIAGGTTNAYIAEEILGTKIDKARYTAGIISSGLQCTTPIEDRLAPIVLIKGQLSERPWLEVIGEFTKDDILIKGANAIDNDGNAGILMSDPFGGTIGRAIGIIFARGSRLIIPAGLEKLIPSVKAAAKIGGTQEFTYSLGMAAGLMPLFGGKMVTEVEALKQMYSLQVTPMAAGGIGGSEGGSTIVIEGPEEAVKDAFAFIKKIKGEPAIKAFKQKCKCNTPCNLHSN